MESSNESTAQSSIGLKVLSCLSLVFFNVSATIFAEASKSDKGSYPYNTMGIPCAVEGIKLMASICFLIVDRFKLGTDKRPLSLRYTPLYAIPALCYFVSNNCMFYVIRHLGASTFQIMNNLKVLTTGVFMHVFLSRTLSWSQWKSLVLLIVGSMVTQSCAVEQSMSQDPSRNIAIGYAFVALNSVASGAGGVFSEKLLKGNGDLLQHSGCNSIHWQNVQLYSFGFVFGAVSLHASSAVNEQIAGVNPFVGFNAFAYATVASLTVSGLLVSFILKYMDNIAKCFATGFGMLSVILLDGAMKHEPVPLQVILGMIITGMALEQYYLP